jgi:two-component system phosphate regulon sensor histidine kinase PhoR
MSRCLQKELALLAFVIVIILLIGLVAGHTAVMILTALLAYLLWHLYNLNRLIRWLMKPTKNTPETVGVWDDIFYQLYQMYQRQRKARRKLSSILSRFQKSTKALPSPTIVLNQYDEIEWFNPAARQIFNFKPKRDVGQRVVNLIRHPRFAAYLRAKKFKEPLELEIGSQKIIINITAYGNGQNLLMARDVTRRSQLDTMRRDFIANASHELRTPITVIAGFVETLLEQADEDIHMPLEKIQQQTERMQRILSELLQLARLESEDHIENMEPVDLKEVLEEIYTDALTMDAGNHDIELSADSMTVTGNREELRMAFSNLMTNAIRYTPLHGKIRIFTSMDENGICACVEDEGVGITTEHIPRLTERFYRVDPGRSRDQGGTGLGLAIVKHVLDRHHGQLLISSQPGSGSVFKCCFSSELNLDETEDNVPNWSNVANERHR